MMGMGKDNPYRVENNSHTFIKSRVSLQIDCVCFRGAFFGSNNNARKL